MSGRAARRVWIDLTNSPHVALFEPVVERLRRSGWEVLLTARDHAQTVPLARRVWPDMVVSGSESPAGLAAKAGAIVRRAEWLRRFARRERPVAALSHGSYAQIIAARRAGVPAVTMMDYEYQPANHLSFRLARRVIVPDRFPAAHLRRCGARRGKIVRYPGFKEELYLAGFKPDPGVLPELGLGADNVIAVFRGPPEGALYHRTVNGRFDQLIDEATRRPDVQVVLLPRTREQERRYRALKGAIVPAGPVDGRSLLACADLLVGGGGTMSRESALMGTPTYTVFNGRLAALDAHLIASGRLRDLRDLESAPLFEKKTPADGTNVEGHAEAILQRIEQSLADVCA